MAQITGGKYTYSRVVKDDDYGIKREFTAELGFTVGEDDPVGDIGIEIAQKVVDIAHEKLRIKGSAPATGPAAAEVQARQGPPPPAPPPAAGPAPINDKERLAQAAGLVPETPAPKPPKKAPKLDKPAPVAADDDLSSLFGDEAPEQPITDKALNDAVQAKNAILKNPPKIVALKEKFAGALPKSLRDIPQEKRAVFLMELAALT